jgi:hypothetical protein
MSWTEEPPPDGEGPTTHLDPGADRPAAGDATAIDPLARDGHGDGATSLDDGVRRPGPETTNLDPVTHADVAAAPTVLDSPGAAGGAGWSDPDRLPPQLAGRFSRYRLLAQGAQAFVFEAWDGEQHVVVRIARPGVGGDHPNLTHVVHPSLARMIEGGRLNDGTHYQVLAFIDGDSLAARLTAGDHFTQDAIRAFVDQVCGALQALDPYRHGDLSPANIIVEPCPSGSGAPRFVLIDYGLTFTTEHTLLAGVPGIPPLYTPLEGFLGDRSRVWDWWSLGMIVAELLIGRHPLAEVDMRTIGYAIANGWIDLSPVTDPRWRLLVRGLLTVDYDHRWTSVQVREWLSGGSPPVVEDRVGAPSPVDRPFRFAGLEFHREPRRLADAFGTHWAAAARVLGSQAPREQLLAWARRFGDADMLATIESSGAPGSSLDQDLIRVIGALYAVPATDRNAPDRIWYHADQMRIGTLRRICVEALAVAEQLVGSTGSPADLDRSGADGMLVRATRLVGGDLDVLGDAARGHGPLPGIAARQRAGMEFVRSATVDLDTPGEDWEQSLWAIHLLACLTSSGAAAALRREAEAVTNRRRDLRELTGPGSSAAHHLVATIRAERTLAPGTRLIRHTRTRRRIPDHDGHDEPGVRTAPTLDGTEPGGPEQREV